LFFFFKIKLEILTGGNAHTMQLELYNGDKFITKLNENDRMLGYYPFENGMRVHVIDNFSYIDENIEKFELTTHQYDNRSDTVKNFLKSNHLGKYDEEEMKKLEEKRKEMIEKEKQLAELCKIGLRCQVTTKGQPKRIGTIMFNGLVEAKKGILIGVKFDEPLGVNNGTYVLCKLFNFLIKMFIFLILELMENVTLNVHQNTEVLYNHLLLKLAIFHQKIMN